MGFNGTLWLYKNACEEPCGNGGNGGNGGTNYQPQIDEINEKVSENKKKITEHDTKITSIENNVNTLASKTELNNVKNELNTKIDNISIKDWTQEINELKTKDNELNTKIDNINIKDWTPEINNLETKDNEILKITQGLNNRCDVNEREIGNIREGVTTDIEIFQGMLEGYENENKELKKEIETLKSINTQQNNEINTLKQNIGKRLVYAQFSSLNLGVKTHNNNQSGNNYAYRLNPPVINGVKVTKENLVNLAFDLSWHSVCTWGWYNDEIFIYFLGHEANKPADYYKSFTCEFTVLI